MAEAIAPGMPFAGMELARMERAERRVVAAGFLGLMANAFDYFLFAFLLAPVAASLGVAVGELVPALFFALAARPMGALVFGWLADHHGRKPVLVGVLVLVAVLSALCSLAPGLGTMLVLRVLLGFAMGGEWGVGAALVMESVQPDRRGLASGLIQAGLPCGALLASLASLALPVLGWRGLCLIGIAPALLALWIRARVDESPVILLRRAGGVVEDGPLLLILRWRLAAYLLVLMLAFTALSHATQDLYPVFLQRRYAMGPAQVWPIVVGMSMAGLCGLLCGGTLSARLGRRRTIIAFALPALAVLPFWVSAGSVLPLSIAAIVMQVCVQGAWSMVPAWLAELSPAGLRATLPGFAFAMADLLTARLAMFQAGFTGAGGGGAGGLALIVGLAVLVLVTLVALGPERSQESG
jgi:SHS family lactate transporter-like MFS transporter